jgi:ABC-type uncharacterized transport system permease subunit
MTWRPVLSVAIRWFVYGALVGILIELGIIWETGDPKRWQTPGALLATMFVVAIAGMITGILRHQMPRNSNSGTSHA